MLSPHYRSARVEYVWQMASVTGEAAAHPVAAESGGFGGAEGILEPGEHATRPHPSLPPEAVVEAQLAALLAEDAATVFAFASPGNQAVTGPLERFSTLLRNPMYRPLLRHRRSTPYRRTMLTSDSYSEVVQIVSDNTGMPQAIEAVYSWELERQGPGAGPLAGCWLTNSVRLLDARPLAS
ncbi:hypothetical protein GPECTOR_1g60 [Gonium pectorale]|uniref:DUF4864 domain-containing protein n=1 Tax=Gonium pectorale TaxID=33097 RepID=A0A150H3B7_GONPE|nr:hypothetical protein GPECTOR_1g60 [Gonium pectorale]|eukprot:KXZ56666.1 hypothetical protein GPECTOR_1g60 [Gonium pectorale]